jgi:hypothetical protein
MSIQLVSKVWHKFLIDEDNFLVALPRLPAYGLGKTFVHHLVTKHA